MGIQINGQTDTISATDGSLNIGGTVTVNVTGDATGLTGTPDITVGVVTASSAVISGDLTVNGTTTTLDTTLTEVDKLEVGANNTTVGVAITQSGSGDILRLYDGATQVVTVKDGGSVGIGTDTPNLQSTSANNLVIADFGGEGGITIKSNINSAGNIFFADTAATANGRIAYGHGATDVGDYMRFYVANGEKLRINANGNVGINTTSPADTLDVNGNILPSFDATHDLGSSSKRWNNVYTTDLQLSNEGSQNDVDGTWGRWTIQEGEDDLFLINRRNGKKYKFVLQEVD